MISYILGGLMSLMDVSVLFLLFGGVIVGIVFGAIPGLSATMAVTLFLPFTYAMNITPGISLLLGLYVGGVSGGLISAILINIPGTPSSIATTFDGGPLAKHGQAGKALGVAIVFSFLGGLFSFIALLLIAPQIALLALKFSPVEYFAVIAFSMTLVSSLAGKDFIRGIISACIGLFISQIGSAPIDGTVRFTLGFKELSGGFDLVAVMIGFFAIPEILQAARDSVRNTKIVKVNFEKIKGFGFSFKEFVSQIPNFIRSALIGTGIGILPGIGGGTSNILAYMAAQKSSKHPEKFGTGIIDGVVASETANNAAIGGAAIPLLTMGIPGDPVTAVLLGGLIVKGIAPGPLFLSTQGTLFYTIFFGLMIANVMMIIAQFSGLRFFVKLLNINKAFMLPSIVVLCSIGAFGSTNRVFNIYAMMICGLVAYTLIRFKFPVTPIIISYVLGNMLEENLRRGLMFTDGNFLGFFKSPIAAVFLAIGILSVVYSIILELKRARSKKVTA